MFERIYKIISKFESHHRIIFSSIVSLCSFMLFYAYANLTLALILAWDVFAASDLLLVYLANKSCTIKETIKNARLQDTGRTAILLFILISTTASFVAIGVLLKNVKLFENNISFFYLIVTLITVALSWCLVHTIFTVHYAHIFYSGGKNANSHHGGLIFPNENNPTFMDFAYFSFGIGTTFQVSDVQVTSRRFRKLVTFHGILSFAYNTFILALAINIVADLF